MIRTFLGRRVLIACPREPNLQAIRTTVLTARVYGSLTHITCVYGPWTVRVRAPYRSTDRTLKLRSHRKATWRNTILSATKRRVLPAHYKSMLVYAKYMQENSSGVCVARFLLANSLNVYCLWQWWVYLFMGLFIYYFYIYFNQLLIVISQFVHIWQCPWWAAMSHWLFVRSACWGMLHPVWTQLKLLSCVNVLHVWARLQLSPWRWTTNWEFRNWLSLIFM